MSEREPDDVLTETEDEATAVAAPAARRRSQKISSIHSAPTQQLPASRSLPSTGDDSQITRQTTATTPVEALHTEEVARTRIFLEIALGIAGLVAVALPFGGGDEDAKKIVYGGLAVAAIACLGTLWKIRDDEAYKMSIITPVAFCLAACSYTGVYYFGVFSPAPAVIVLGIYFYSLGSSRGSTLALYLFCVAGQVGLSLLVTFELIADPGLVRADNISTRDQLTIAAIVQVVFFAAYLIGRRSRQTTLDAVAGLERAVRSVAQREALLLEARADLDRALRVGGPGRFSDQQVGSFRLGVLIGRGGMGEVYEARHVDTDQLAAVKLLHPHVLANPDHVSRFERETRMAQSLDVPNVVAVLEVGRTEGEVPYLALERLHGHDLAHHLRQKRRLSVARVIEMVRQVAAGLEAARAAGIVHRDIKPQNLFRADQHKGDPVWKILDFGVSKLADQGGTLTRGNVVGTPGYMAPEQARAQPVDHRADVYALAAITYRALTGRPAFSGKDLPSTLYDVVYKMPVRPSKLREKLLGDIDLVLAVGLAKRRDDRFARAVELADALAAAARSELDEAIRARARALLDTHPWGVRL